MSAVAPLVPVIRLAVTAVLSVVVSESVVMSAAAITVMVLTSLSVFVPPAPRLPKSLVSMVSCTVPLKSATGK